MISAAQAVAAMTDAPLTQSISYHAWNKDRSQLAISPNTDEGQPGTSKASVPLTVALCQLPRD